MYVNFDILNQIEDGSGSAESESFWRVGHPILAAKRILK